MPCAVDLASSRASVSFRVCSLASAAKACTGPRTFSTSKPSMAAWMCSRVSTRGFRSNAFRASSLASRPATAAGAGIGRQGTMSTSNARCTRLGAVAVKAASPTTAFFTSPTVTPSLSLISCKERRGELIGSTSRLCSTGPRSISLIAFVPPSNLSAICRSSPGSAISSLTSLVMIGIVNDMLLFKSSSSGETFPRTPLDCSSSAETSSLTPPSFAAARLPYRDAQPARQPPPSPGAKLAGSASAFSSAPCKSCMAFVNSPTISACPFPAFSLTSSSVSTRVFVNANPLDPFFPSNSDAASLNADFSSSMGPAIMGWPAKDARAALSARTCGLS
mmetsp:Transcript_60893/g.181436  ORF Transcript_60893/g.181436 Transcript_60893/m.181436 type:complete len:334 (-) Transcript_60893:7-1008(-)